MRWLSRLVSFVVITAIIAAAVVLVRSKMPETRTRGRFETFALFRYGSRLAVGSPVMIAGVRVGNVYKLTVDRDFARVDMYLADNTDIPIDSWITKKAESAQGFMEQQWRGRIAGADRWAAEWRSRCVHPDS